MSRFAVKKIESIVGKQVFYDLLVDNISQFESFYNQIKDNGQYISEMKTILSYMNFVSNLKLLPNNKFKDITPSNCDVKEYEFKSKHLRAYIFHLEHKGKMVTLWGHKNTQPSDIKRFRSLKKQYLEQ